MGTRKYQYADGEVIFRAGDQADTAYVVESGQVHIIAGEVLLNTLKPGALLGEMGILDNTTRTATAIANGETVLTLIDRTQMTERIANADPVLRMLIEVLLARFRSTLSRVRDNQPISEAQDAHNPYDTGTFDASTMDKIRLEAELRNAVHGNELQVWYQPILDLNTRRWAGFESLVRWEHPERGFISPESFVALAEETGLICPIGSAVMTEACKRLARFQALRNEHSPGHPPLFMGVNVSARQLDDREFIETIGQVVQGAGTRSRNIKLEITESLLIDYKVVKVWVDNCRSQGFSVTLDDFGTGYSGFQHLLELEFDTVKIDQTFVRSVLINERSELMVRGIVGMAKAMKMKVVAEGVENQDQLELLADMGVDYAQGFWVGKPAKDEEIARRIDQGA
ncbi:MAG: EAL domain-containing protein [Gammaproteobacteria bacterium]